MRRPVLSTIFLGYLLLHLFLYLLWFRRLRHFGGEAGIFLYHALPACVLGLLGLANVAVEQSAEAVAGLVFVLAGHGIYSLSFLELWSLAQGSYSLQVLDAVERHPGAMPAPVRDELEWVGAKKKAGRLSSLEQLRLIDRRGRVFLLSYLGVAVSAGLLALARLANQPTE